MSVGGGTWSWQNAMPNVMLISWALLDTTVVAVMVSLLLHFPHGSGCWSFQYQTAKLTEVWLHSVAYKLLQTKSVKYFILDLTADDLESQSHQPGDSPQQPTTSATSKVTPDTKVAWTPRKSRLQRSAQRSRTKLHRLKRSWWTLQRLLQLTRTLSLRTSKNWNG